LRENASVTDAAAPAAALDAELRGQIRELGQLLGETISRQVSPDTLVLVERVRQLVRENPNEAAALLDSVDLGQATVLARAFSIYFDLANIAE